MHNQVTEMVGYGLVLLVRLTHDGLESKYHIAEQERPIGWHGGTRGPRRKRENIGRAVDPSPNMIELPLFCIVRENDRQLNLLWQRERSFRSTPRQRQACDVARHVLGMRKRVTPRGAKRNDFDLDVRQDHAWAVRVARSRAS